MKNKIFFGILSACVLLGGALAAAASWDDGQPVDDSNMKQAPKVIKNVELEQETKNGKSSYKVETEDSTVAPPALAESISVESAAKIATKTVNGKVTKIEKDMEDGRLEYKFEIQTKNGETEVRIDAETGKVTRVEDGE